MTLLAGQEAEGTEAATANASEVVFAERVEVLATGTGEVLHVKLALAFTGTVELAVLKDEGAGSPPGAVVQETSATGTTQTLYEATITGTALTAGEFVWLAWRPSASAKIKLGSTVTSRPSNGKVAKISEAVWGTVRTTGPISLWLSGTSGGGTTGTLSSAASVPIRGTDQIAAQAAVGSRSPVKVAGADAIAAQAALVSKAVKVKIGGSAAIVGAGAGGTSRPLILIFDE